MLREKFSHNQKQIIATWLYLENFDEKGLYPQVPGNSASRHFQEIYKKCLVTFFTSARFANPDSQLLLFTNTDIFARKLLIDKKIEALLHRLQVQIYKLEYTYRPPENQKYWRNQFFVFNILEYLAHNLQKEQLCLVLDGDIVWSGNNSTQYLWNCLDENGYLTMTPISNKQESINGINLGELRELSNNLQMGNGEIEYAGGEFIALRGDKLGEVFSNFRVAWNNLQILQSNMGAPIIEEAHLLSIIYAKMGFIFGNGNSFVRRIWTQVLHHENRMREDLSLVLWHLPAEKRFGIRRLANKILRDGEDSWPNLNSRESSRIIALLGVNGNGFVKTVKDLARSFFDRQRLKIFD